MPSRNGTPPVVSYKSGQPTNPPDVANKNYVDNIIPIVPVPPVYTATGTATRDIMVQGYIPTGVNTTFRLSVLGGLLYKQGDTGNEFPNTPIRTTMDIRTIRIFMHSVSQNLTGLKLTFFKDDNPFIEYRFTIPASSRNSNIISVGPRVIPYNDGDWGYATIEITGSIAANFCTIVMSSETDVKITITEQIQKDTAMQVKDTAKQQSPGLQQIKRKTISQRLLSIFR